ncbi:MAG: hypothetical protein ACK5PP_15320 [Acidimicrobiales bacterium]
MLAAGCGWRSADDAATGPDPESPTSIGGGTDPAAPPVSRWPGNSPAGAVGGLVPTGKVGLEEMSAFFTEAICEPDVDQAAAYAGLECNRPSGDVRLVAYQFDDPEIAWVQGSQLTTGYIATDVPEWCTYGMVVDEWVIFLFHRETREAAQVVSTFQTRFWDALTLVVGCLFDTVEQGPTVIDFERSWADPGWCNPDYRGNVVYRKLFAERHPDIGTLPAGGFVCSRNEGDVSAAVYPTAAEAELAVDRLREEAESGECHRIGLIERWVFEEDTPSATAQDRLDFEYGLDLVRASVVVDCP